LFYLNFYSYEEIICLIINHLRCIGNNRLQQAGNSKPGVESCKKGHRQRIAENDRSEEVIGDWAAYESENSLPTKAASSVSALIATQSSAQLSAHDRLHYWRDSNAYIQDQASIIFKTTSEVLAAYPPAIKVGNERMLALMSLDALLHDSRLDYGKPFLNYVKNGYNNVLTELKKNKPKGKQIRFYRLYNHGFIVQTASVTVGIDLIRGGKADRHFIDDSLMNAIVERCDILFISHAHGDHADMAVAEMFCARNKKVIVPKKFRHDMPFTVLRGDDMIGENIRLQTASLKVQVYPGHQGDVLNNVYIITFPEGQTVMHTGDQDYTDDLVTKIGAASNIDVLLVHCWMMPMEKFISGVNPKLIICGHENEMEHTIDHREAYWLTFRRMSGVKIPYVVMAWGECYPTDIKGIF
jgi:L-ascorbate metabolism protein UlaG (beta-lactamase superfamily)